MKTMKESPIDFYSKMQGKKEVVKEINDLKSRGYSDLEIIKHLQRMYSK
jgi:hypothetical protein